MSVYADIAADAVVRWERTGDRQALCDTLRALIQTVRELERPGVLVDCPNCHEGIEGPDEQCCMTCGGAGVIVAHASTEGGARS